jgi:hypothetical protein
MENEFVSYEIALALKELSFDKPCFGFYVEKNKWIPASYSKEGTEYPSNSNLILDWVSAPLYQQAFKFFRENYGLEHKILRDSYGCRYQITNVTPTTLEDIDCKGQYSNTSYDEADYNCIIRLIEEVKGEKHSSSKVKTLASVDVEKLEGIQKFVEYAVTESRFKQSLENVFPNNEPIDVKKMGEVIRWVVNDITKEEMDTMVANNIEPKDVNKYVSTKVREMFFKLS